MNKINYNLEMEKIIDKIDLDNPPSVLIHSCCGPCSSAVLERLNEYFKITVMYYNPNLDTREEFDRRVKEQIRLIDSMPQKNKIKFEKIDYFEKEFYEKIKGHENEREGGERCRLCYELRLEKVAIIAKQNGLDYFTTTLSISPHKDSRVLNLLGEELSKKYDIKYLYSDFKKKEGYKRSVELCRQYHMYRQNYCGCKFSKIEAEQRESLTYKPVY